MTSCQVSFQLGEKKKKNKKKREKMPFIEKK